MRLAGASSAWKTLLRTIMIGRMKRIEAFIAHYGQPATAEVWRTNSRTWLGQRPNVQLSTLPKKIAAMVGYPTSEPDWFEQYKLRPVNRTTAATALAYIATKSLAYDRGPPREDHEKEAVEALSDFAPDAVFLTNSVWEYGEFRGSDPFTSATFDAGIIVYDSNIALIYWVEDED
jgi:carboxylesterase type B